MIVQAGLLDNTVTKKKTFITVISRIKSVFKMSIIKTQHGNVAKTCWHYLKICSSLNNTLNINNHGTNVTLKCILHIWSQTNDII